MDLLDAAAPDPVVVDQVGKADAAGAARAMALQAVGLEGGAAAGQGEVEQFGVLGDVGEATQRELVAATRMDKVAVNRVEEGEDYLRSKFEAALKSDQLEASERGVVQAAISSHRM